MPDLSLECLEELDSVSVAHGSLIDVPGFAPVRVIVAKSSASFCFGIGARELLAPAGSEAIELRLAISVRVTPLGIESPLLFHAMQRIGPEETVLRMKRSNVPRMRSSSDAGIGRSGSSGTTGE